jgi:hypothetical protein
MRLAGSVPAEKTFNRLSNDCRNPWAIWLRQLLPVHNIKILITYQFGNLKIIVCFEFHTGMELL